MRKTSRFGSSATSGGGVLARLEEVGERLVEQHPHALAHALAQRAHVRARDGRARGVVGARERDGPRVGSHPLRQRVERLPPAPAVPPARWARSGSGRQPGHATSSSPAVEQLRARVLQQLGGAVADRDLVGPQAVALRRELAHLGRRRVGVGVHAPPQREGGGVDRLGVRRLVPGRAAEVELGHEHDLARPLLVAALAQLARHLVGRQRLELPVAVEEALHFGASVGPGPSMIRNQKPNASAATIAVTMKMRESTPSRWSIPPARRTTFQIPSSRTASASVSISDAIMPTKATTIPKLTESVW